MRNLPVGVASISPRTCPAGPASLSVVSVAATPHQGGRPHIVLYLQPLCEHAGDDEEFVLVDLVVLDGELEHLDHKLVIIYK